MHRLIIDIGNSSTKAAIFKENTLIEHHHLEHSELPHFLERQAANGLVQCAIVSSVIPLDKATEEAFQALPFLCLRMSNNLKMPFSIAYKTPETLGTDRLAAVAGAWSIRPGHNLLVIDIGTAITYDIITAEGIYLGGNISPGIDMRFNALSHYTGKLPLISKEGKRVEIGDSTETAIREGVLQGVDGEIESYIFKYIQKYPNLLVFLTGGGAFLLGNRIKNRIFADNLLVIKGLNCILTQNNESI